MSVNAPVFPFQCYAVSTIRSTSSSPRHLDLPSGEGVSTHWCPRARGVLNILRKESEVVPEGSDPVHQEEEFGSGQPTPGPFQRVDEIWGRRIEVITRLLEQHLASQERDARQPRLAMDADGPANAKTRERTEGAATAVQAVHGDSFSVCRVDPGPKINSTSFGMMAEASVLPCRDDVIVEDSAAASKSCLPSLEMRSATAAGDLVSTGEISTATETPVNEPVLQFYSTEEENSKKKKYGLQFHPPGTTAASGKCFLSPPA